MTIGFSWISLDSLVQMETYQWVTRPEGGNYLPHGFVPGVERRGTEPAVEAMLKGATVHGASLIYFLIFCNLLSSEPFFGCLHPKELTRGAPLSKFEGRHPEAAVEPHLGAPVLVHARRLEDRRHMEALSERDGGRVGFRRIKKDGAPGARAMSPANRRSAVFSSSANSGPILKPSWQGLRTP
jgi:hypothetical protein